MRRNVVTSAVCSVPFSISVMISILINSFTPNLLDGFICDHAVSFLVVRKEVTDVSFCIRMHLTSVFRLTDEIMQQEIRPLLAMDIIEQLHRQFALLSGM